MLRALSLSPLPNESRQPCKIHTSDSPYTSPLLIPERIDDAKSPKKRFRGGLHAFATILRERGPAGVYRGLLSTTMKQSATSAVRMGSYNVLKEVSRRHNIQQNSATTFGMGAVAGTITVYATQPFDTIKTRAQSAKGASTLEACRAVFQDHGARGFWSGSTMRLGRLVMSGGIVFTIYEEVASLLDGLSPKSL